MPDGTPKLLSLRFLSGPSRGSEYVLDDLLSIVAGRADDSMLLLSETMVSRRHARFYMDSDQLCVEDLGSTNGTFVNGEKVGKRPLIVGDRVLIGVSILKVILSEAPAGTRPPSSRLVDTDQVTKVDGDGMAGDLDEVSVPELIEMFGSARQKLVLEIRSNEKKVTIYMAEGRILDCYIQSLPDAPAHKCILRVLGFESGVFVVRKFEEPEERRLNLPVPELLVHGLLKLDAVQILRRSLPATGEAIAIAKPLMVPLGALSEADLAILQLAHNHNDVQLVLDHSLENDAQAAQRLLALLDRGYVRRL